MENGEIRIRILRVAGHLAIRFPFWAPRDLRPCTCSAGTRKLPVPQQIWERKMGERIIIDMLWNIPAHEAQRW
eukprot:6029968-Pyramimonas_sp.AAC.1